MRQSYTTSGGFSPVKLLDSFPVNIALDNLVCFHCGKPLGDEEYMLVSTPKRKGILVFSCASHISDAMNFLSKALDGAIAQVPDNLKLPDEKNN
jgi:hypothetical protein